MNFTKFIIIFSAILLQTTSASFNYKFKPLNLSSYEIQETIIGHSSMECCIYCRINFFCEAVMFAEGNSCILLTQIQIASDGSASDGFAADGSAADGSAADGSAADWPAADGSAAEGSAAEGSEFSADASASITLAYVLQNRYCSTFNQLRAF